MPEAIDHTPLWRYITAGAASESGGLCTPTITNRAGMAACLAAWNAWIGHTVPLFTADLVKSPRFAAVPILDADPGGGFGNYLVTDFRPVYIETIYLKCSANTCDIVHSPGESAIGPCPSPLTAVATSCGWPSGGNKGIEAVSAFILKVSMLDTTVAKSFPSRPGTVVFNLSS